MYFCIFCIFVVDKCGQWTNCKVMAKTSRLQDVHKTISLVRMSVARKLRKKIADKLIFFFRIFGDHLLSVNQNNHMEPALRVLNNRGNFLFITIS